MSKTKKLSLATANAYADWVNLRDGTQRQSLFGPPVQLPEPALTVNRGCYEILSVKTMDSFQVLIGQPL